MGAALVDEHTGMAQQAGSLPAMSWTESIGSYRSTEADLPATDHPSPWIPSPPAFSERHAHEPRTSTRCAH
jgi:hypothetical protein